MGQLKVFHNSIKQLLFLLSDLIIFYVRLTDFLLDTGAKNIKEQRTIPSMNSDIQLIGETTIAKASSTADYKRLLKDPILKSDPIIVKPNWVLSEEGSYTTASSLRCLFEALPGKIIVTESYQTARVWDDPTIARTFKVGDEVVDWTWFRGKGWLWLHSHPDWTWFKDSMWSEIRKGDNNFLERLGFRDLFQEFGVDYVNVTEEVWSGRAVDSGLVKEIVEKRYSPVFTDRLYGIVPERLYRHRGATLISFNRLKEYGSFTFKNLFGLIPDPNRSWWHGPRDRTLSLSIVDAAKVYASLFSLYGLWEYAGSTRLRRDEGKFGGPEYRFDMAVGPGILVFGRNFVELDALLCHLNGFKVKDAEHIELAEQVFGANNRQLLGEAEKCVGSWFKPSS